MNATHKAVYYMFIASIFFVGMGVIVKILAKELPAIELVFFRNFFTFSFVLISLIFIPNKKRFRGGKVIYLNLRGIIAVFSMLAIFYNLQNMPIAYAMTFSRTAPIFTAFFAFFLLKERVRWTYIIYIFVAFFCVVYIINPDFEQFNLGLTISSLASGVLAGFVYTIVRMLRYHYSSRIIILFLGFWGSVIPLVFMLFNGNKNGIFFIEFITPDFHQWILILLLGAISTLAQIFMTKSYKLHKAAIVSMVSYSSIIFSLFIDYFILNNIDINFGIILAIFTIITMGFLAFISENSSKKLNNK